MKKFPLPTIDIKRYGGKQVAIFEGKIVAVGKDTIEVLTRARRRLPRTKWSDILLVSVPRTLHVIYLYYP